MNRFFSRWAQNAFSIDLRTLALFRVALATVLLADLTLRFGGLGAFYADAGALPRALLIGTDGSWRLSLFLVAGETVWAGLLLIAAWLAAAAMWFGWRTRTAIAVLFVLLISLHGRNPLLLTAGDSLLVCLLFWSLFLPLGARWSADAAVASRPPTEPLHLSFASAGLLIQVIAVYFFSALLKSGAGEVPGSLALQQLLQLERHTTSFGAWLGQSAGLAQGLSRSAYLLEWLAPLLAFSPIATRSLRLVAMLLLMALQIVLWLSLDLGLFPVAGLASLTLLAGGWLWDLVDARARLGRDLHIHYDSDCGFCRASCELLRVFLILPRARIEPAQDTPRARALMDAHWSWVVIDHERSAHLKFDAFIALLRASPLLWWLAPLLALPPLVAVGNRVYDLVAKHRGGVAKATGAFWRPRDVPFGIGRVANVLAAAFIVAVLAWNLGNVGLMPQPVMSALTPVFHPLRMDQSWDQTALGDPPLDGWIVMPGELENGNRVDVLKPGQALDWARGSQDGQRWRQFRWRLPAQRSEALYEGYGHYLCRQWNRDAEGGARLQRFDMVYVIVHRHAESPAPETERQTVWRHFCVTPSGRESIQPLLPDLDPTPADETGGDTP